MRKIASIVLLIAVAATIGFAQNNKRLNTWNHLRHGEIKEAQQAINEAIEHPQTEKDGRTWHYRGLVYMAIYGHEELKPQNPDALDIARESFEKSLKYDDRDRHKSDNIKGLAQIAIEYFNAGVNHYSEQNYMEAAENFQKYQATLNVVEPGKVDADAIFYTAQAYFVSEEFKLAERMLDQLIDLEYDNKWIYLARHQVHLNNGDTSQALAIIEKGRKAYPEDKELALYETQLYIISGRHSELISKLQEAHRLDPENAMVMVAMGNAYDRLDKKDSAIYAYKKALEIDKESYDANFNIGITYFNQAVELVNKAINEKDNRKYAKMKSDYEALFKKAEPYLLKAHSINPKDKNPVASLSEIYVRLGDMEKAQEMRAKITQ